MAVPGPLPPPPEDISRLNLPVIELHRHWFRSHGINKSPVYYGRNARYRFDDPAGDHRQSQLWSRALHSHPDQVDGLYYPTCHDPRRKAAAIFNESLSWTTLSRDSWLSLGLTLRDVLNDYGFGLIESQVVQPAVRKRVKQELLF